MYVQYTTIKMLKHQHYNIIITMFLTAGGWFQYVDATQHDYQYFLMYHIIFIRINIQTNIYKVECMFIHKLSKQQQKILVLYVV